MKKKIIKQNLRFYSKFLLLIGALIAFVCSFGVSSYAWSTDSNGNLVSDNLIDNSTSVFEMGAVSYNIGNTYAQNKVSSNARIRTINLISVDSSLTYSLSVPSPYLVIAQGYNNGLQVSQTGTQFNQALTSLSFSGVDAVSIIVKKSDNSNFTSIDDISSIDLMFNIGNVKDYEPYGVTYYSTSNMDKITHVNFGAFAFCDLIKVRYYNPNDLIWYDYKTFNNVYDFIQEKYVTFRNQSLIIDDFKLIFTELGGNSDWRYQIYVSFPSNAIRVENYNVWVFNSASNVDLNTYTGTGYHGTNVGTISLTSEGFSSSDYLQYIYYTRISPNIAVPTGSFGTPNSSVQYNQGYNDGYEVGKDDGFSSGFDDGKKEGIDIGYREGYRDGEESDFTTNGFKTLIGSIFNYPINMIRSIFNFEFMGINIYSIIVFIMSIGIVIFVIRRFKK